MRNAGLFMAAAVVMGMFCLGFSTSAVAGPHGHSGHHDSVHVYVGVHGAPAGYYHEPHWRPRAHHHSYWAGGVYVYDPYPPVIVEGPVVVERPAPVVVQEPAVVVQPVTAVYISRQQQLIDKVLRGDAKEREGAAKGLAEYKGPATIAALFDVLINDGNGMVRQAAAESMGKIGDPMGFEVLLRCADAETEDNVREAAKKAAEAVAAAAGENLVTPQRIPQMNYGEEKLADYLDDLRLGQAKVREKAAEKMGKCRGTQPVAALVNAAVNDASKDVRKEAAESLGKIGDRIAIPFLKSVEYNDRDKGVRKEAKKAVEKIRNTIPQM